MEDWQVSCITKSLDKLIQTTICNVMLLASLVASNILSESDSLTIETEKHPHERAKKLYNFLKTRKNGFPCLARALRDYKQSGALEILKSNLLQQDAKIVLSATCNSDDFKYLLARIPDTLLQKEVLLHKEEYFKICLFQENQTEFIINTIPKCPQYYVPRSISNRLRLDPRIFKVQCPDVFVFKDIERHRLSKLVKPLGTESSSTQMDELTCKFIHLNDEADFSVICQNGNGKPIHLVKFEIFNEQQCFILEESYGNSQVLRNFLDESRNQDRCFVSEDEFIHNIEPTDNKSVSKGYCICDSPGSGKTWLLASLARKMETKYTDKMILFQKLSEIDLLNDSIDDSVDYLVSKICPNPFVRTLIKTAINENSIKMEIFLDAFDEVEGKHMEAAKRFLSSLKTSSENVRLFVTSRPHTRHELESALGVVAYDIRPFDKQNQLDFLEQCWRTLLPCSINESRLQDFAKACQAKVQSSLSPQEKDILGIPLQCHMIAEIYLHKAKMYCKSSKATLNQFLESPASLYQMYKQFITMKLQKLTSQINEDGKRIKCFHTWKALEIFSSKLALLYKQAMLPKEEFSDLKYLSSGILEGVVNIDNILRISFVHQTFAEYLVAEFISDVLTIMQNSHENFCKLKRCLMEFVTNEIFQLERREYCLFRLKSSLVFDEDWPDPGASFFKLRSAVIPFFLNEHLSFAFSNDSQNVGKSDSLLEFLRPNHLFEMLCNCAKFGWLYLIILFTRQLQSVKGKPEEILLYRSVLLGPQLDWKISFPVERPVFLLCIAAKFSNISLLRQCVQFYKECFDYDCIDAIKGIPIWVTTPYHEALERGDYSMVEYFMQFDLPYGNRRLLHQCIGGSYAEDDCKVNTKLQIISLLLNDSEHLIWDMEHANVHGPLIKSLLSSPRISLKIVKHLVAKMQQNMQTNYSPLLATLDFEILKTASGCMNRRELHELCRIFFEDLNITRTANTKRQLVDVLESILERQDLEHQTLQMVLKEFSSAELSDLSSGLLYQGTFGNQSTETFELLVKHGVNLFAKDEQGSSVIHYAAKFGKQNILKYLLKKGFSVNQQTLSGKTPLMVSSAANHPEMLLFLLRNGATISLRDKAGETFLHKFAWNLQDGYLEFSPEIFKEMVTFLCNQPEAMEILKSKSWKQIWTAMREPSYSLYCNLSNLMSKSTVMLLCEKLELDFSSCIVGLNGNNVLLKGIGNGMSLELLDILVECGSSINSTNKRGQNALHLAARADSWQTVAYILNKSSLPINAKDAEGNTPLHLITELFTSDWKTAKILLEHGADPFSVNQKDKTFAHNAAWLSYEAEFRELISFLQKLTNDPDIQNTKNHNGQTLLHARLKKTIFRSLDNFTLNQIKHNPGVDVNLADNFGNTIFLLLGKLGEHWDVVKYLAETKACVTSKTNEGYSVIHYAAKQGNLEMVQYFHSLGLSLDEKTVKGDSPILLAFRHLPVIKYLYAEGCDICAVNKKGETILHKAVSNNPDDTFVDLVLFLKKCNVTQPFVQNNFTSRCTALHKYLNSGYSTVPGYLINWIVNLPEYDISAEDHKRNTIFQTAIENWHKLETCAIDAIYSTYCASVQPETLRGVLLKELAVSVDRKNSDAVRYLLKKGANPNPREVNCPIPIEMVIMTLRENKNRKWCTFFQLNLILTEFLMNMLNDKSILCATDSQGNTFLHAIANFSHPNDLQLIVSELCKSGFTDIFQMKNNSGKTPITIAAKSMQLTKETLRILGQYGIFTNSSLNVDSDSDSKTESDFHSDSDADSEYNCQNETSVQDSSSENEKSNRDYGRTKWCTVI